MGNNHFEIYTDGSHKEAWGAWAFVIACTDKIFSENSARVRNTTSYRMEFQAAIEALKALPANSTATIFSDCKIMIDAMTLTLEEWRNNGWKKAKGKEIPHVDLLIELDQQASRHNISWKWIKGHSGIPYNERCDQLCRL